MGFIEGYSLAPFASACEQLKLFVDGHEVWVEQHGEIALARFVCDGAVRVAVKPAGGVHYFDIRPRSRRIRAEWTWAELTFTIPGPGRYWLEMAGCPPMILTAQTPPPETPAAGKVRYFGPGEHDAGLMELRDDETIYLHGNALVHGGVIGSPHAARIIGHGVLDAGRLERPHKVIELVGAEEVDVAGIVVRQGPCWTMAPVGCRRIAFRDLTVISHGRNGDGIDVVACRDVLIENCLFRCTDDCIALKNHVDPRFVTRQLPEKIAGGGDIENVEVRGCVMVGWHCSDGFTIGFESRGAVTRNVRVHDCDILYARGHSAANGHSAFSIICDGPVTVSDILFENLRVEEDVLKNFECRVTNGQCYSKAPPGRIEDVAVRNVQFAARRPIELTGYGPQNAVRNIRFERCSVAGEPLDSPRSGDVRMGAHVENVQFAAESSARQET